eukprot:ctg_1471.g494
MDAVDVPSTSKAPVTDESTSSTPEVGRVSKAPLDRHLARRYAQAAMKSRVPQVRGSAWPSETEESEGDYHGSQPAESDDESDIEVRGAPASEGSSDFDEAASDSQEVPLRSQAAHVVAGGAAVHVCELSPQCRVGDFAGRGAHSLGTRPSVRVGTRLHFGVGSFCGEWRRRLVSHMGVLDAGVCAPAERLAADDSAGGHGAGVRAGHRRPVRGSVPVFAPRHRWFSAGHRMDVDSGRAGRRATAGAAAGRVGTAARRGQPARAIRVYLLGHRIRERRGG